MLSLLNAEARGELEAFVADQVKALLVEAGASEPAVESPWMTVGEAATALRTTQGAIYKRIKRGQLEAKRPEGSRILLLRTEIIPAGPQP